ncbi:MULTISPECIES: YicC/YloC family endoribonuclease [Spongiibacter]|uniref:YicC/YloC family endoribonuclease n=2 Tax=Spongiibacteraceae TaxID=1706375 RepID=UPI0023528280|nr:MULTISPECIES: YicC/YloC family endoribonuclease [Spongiibacter]|tara:strand:- start:57 stop:950 length:894 start_codon:yes stop_codon:yes gene_type:complete
MKLLSTEVTVTISSMTAFAHRRSEHPWGTAIWELRSVNHRYLELSFKLPEGWRQLEPELRDRLRNALQRGKVECSLRLSLQDHNQQLQLNKTLAQQLLDTAHQLRTDIAHAAPIDVLDIMRWPGVMQSGELDGDTITKDLLAAFVDALDDQRANRQREGDELALLIEQRLSSISEIVTDLRARMPEIVSGQRDKLRSRLAELQAELDAERLEQEMALIAQKADVDEELDRLDTHVKEVRRVLKKGGAVGRRLDFLMQELNREANTLSSKAVVAESTQAAVELKVLIEQMREQIQNIE